MSSQLQISNYNDEQLTYYFLWRILFILLSTAMIICYSDLLFAADTTTTGSNNTSLDGTIFTGVFCKVINLTKSGPATFFATMVIFGIGWQAFQGKISIWVSGPSIIGVIFVMKGPDIAAYVTGVGLACGSI